MKIPNLDTLIDYFKRIGHTKKAAEACINRGDKD